MNTTSKQIENELNQTTKRVDELTEMRNGITTNLETLQKGFVDGKTSLDELQTEQGKLTILNESIKALEAKQDELHSAFQKASLSESRSAKLKQMKEIANEAQTAFNEYVALRSKFNEIIALEGGKMVDALSLFRGKQQQFERAFRELTPGVTNFNNVPSESSKAYSQTRSELSEIGLSNEKLNFVASTHQNLPKIEFFDSVQIITQAIGNKRFNEQQKQRQSVLGAERAKKAAELEAKRQQEKRLFDDALEAERKRISDYRTKNKMEHLSAQEIDSFARENLAKQTAQIAA